MIDDEVFVCNWNNECNKGSFYLILYFYMLDFFDDLIFFFVFFVVFCRRLLNE